MPISEARKQYLKEYHANRLANDVEFRADSRKRSREYQARRREKIRQERLKMQGEST